MNPLMNNPVVQKAKIPESLMEHFDTCSEPLEDCKTCIGVANKLCAAAWLRLKEDERV